MGEVYRARDTRLDREVALKILPARFAGNPQAVVRFEREARAVAALSHPNILAIHDVGSEGGVTFTVTELLQGDTLRDRLLSGHLPLRKALDYATQIAQGLSAAHAKGITHRDIKPENLFVTTDGHVKILDFGLAKFDVEEPSERVTAEHLPTETGTVLGTAAYMSPEQAQGKAADARSDIFSFGAVLYEMVSGERAFKGESVIDTLHRIVHNGPPQLDKVLPGAPHELVRIVSKCLARDPDDRYQSTRDLVVDVRAMARSLDSSPQLAAASATAPAATTRSRQALTILAGIAVLVALVTLGLLWHNRGGASVHDAAFERAAVERVTNLGTVIDAVISPDGKYVAYTTSDNNLQGLWIRQLASRRRRSATGE
jgi:serine/threonine protein kinase